VKNEAWRKHPDFPNYSVSNMGKVKSLFMDRLLKPAIATRGGYERLCLADKDGKRRNISVHTLVLEAFVCARPKGHQCAHLNGKGNDNRLVNLKWCTPEENASHKILHGTHQEAEAHPKSKLTNAQVEAIRRDYRIVHRTKSNCKELARKYGVDRTTIARVVYRRAWESV
jgi:HNH endonuclease/NUMOD4 motif